MTLGELATRLGGSLVDGDLTATFEGFQTDSRDVGAGDVFLAVRGASSDGHAFVPDVIAKGAAATVAEQDVPGPHILVKDLVRAIASFGLSVRDEFSGPVIGITGSNGKTTTKEFLAAALSASGPVLKSQGNRNTEYTSPLLWHDLRPEHWAVVVEMGMRGFGQIAHLAAVARPTIGIVTCVGTAHAEKVGSRAGIAAAKGELLEALPPDGTAVVWREDDFFAELASCAQCEVKTFGFSPESDLRVVGYRALDWASCEVLLELSGESASAKLPVIGRHQALNAGAAVLAAVSAGTPFRQAVSHLDRAELPPLRMEVRQRNGATVLVDTYNASPDSTVAALRALYEGPTEGRRLAVLGEMKELGDFTESGHRAVGAGLDATKLDSVLLTGGPTRFIFEEAVSAGFPAARIAQLSELDVQEVRKFLDTAGQGDVVLVKGSRALGLERAL